MSVMRFACPACHAVLQSGNPLEEGRKIKCHECGVIFPVRHLHPSQVPQPAVATAVPEPATAPRPSRAASQRTYDSQVRAYERQQEKGRSLTMALGSILVLLLLSGLVVGLFALSGKDADTRVAKNDGRSPGQSSAGSRGSLDQARPSADNAGPKERSEEEDEPPKQEPTRSGPPPGSRDPGRGPYLPPGGGDGDKPRMPRPGDSPPLGFGGVTGMRGPGMPEGPGGNGTPQYPGYPPGYKPPEGEGEDKPPGDSSIPPGYPGTPRGKSSSPGSPRRPNAPGNPGPGGLGPVQGINPGGNDLRPGFPPNRAPSKEDPSPDDGGVKSIKLPGDWPKYRTDYPNLGLELSFQNTLAMQIVVGIRSERTAKGFAQGTDLNAGPDETATANLRNGQYEVFLAISKDPKYHTLGKIELENEISYRIVKEGGKYVLRATE